MFERERSRFGGVAFLGGLELRSADPEFGGISAAVIDPDGRGFIAMSDHAHFISGRFIDEGGVLKGVERGRVTPMVAPDGRRQKDTRYFDTEGLCRQGRYAYVSVERTQDILQYDIGGEGLSARGRVIETPAEMKKLDYNLGVEAIGILPKESPFAGALIALAERAPAACPDRNNPGWILGPKGGRLTVRRSGAFDITDLNFLPGGDMLILERRFTPFLGLGCRIRRIAAATIRPGAVLDGEVILEADQRQQIDNMEALTVHRGADGRVLLTVFSDDNFSILQRTLVLRFALAAPD